MGDWLSELGGVVARALIRGRLACMGWIERSDRAVKN